MSPVRELLEVEGLGSNADALIQAAQMGPKALLDALKEAGVAKMGARQRLSKDIREHIAAADKAKDGAAAGGRSLNDSAASQSELGDTGASNSSCSDFWSSMIDVSESCTGLDLDLAPDREHDGDAHLDVVGVQAPGTDGGAFRPSYSRN